MSWGIGHGVPWGGDGVVPTPNQLAEVAGEPTSFIFTDEPDGPLPGDWEHFQLETTAGVIVGSAEPLPDTYYRVTNGLGLWAYARAPVAGDPSLERGVAASPSAALEGRNSRVAAFFVNPLALRDDAADEFAFEVVVGVRLKDAGTEFVGGRARASWTPGGGWAPAVTIEAVQAVSAAPVVLSTAVLPETSKETDLWANGQQHELEVEVREGTLTVTLDGWVQTSATIADDGPSKALLMVRAYNRYGTLIVPRPAVIGMELLSLRDAERLGPAPQLEGSVSYEAPMLPVRNILSSILLDGALWARVGGRTFRARVDQAHNVGGAAYAFSANDLIRITEKMRGQFLVPFVPDLAGIRGRRGR